MDCTLAPTGETRGADSEYRCLACGRNWWSAHPPERLHRMCGSLLARHHATGGPCIHRAAELRQQECTTCQGNVRIKVFGCALHGECALERSLPAAEGAPSQGSHPAVRACSVCPDRRADDRPPRLLIAARHGLGDAVQLSIVLAHLRQKYPGAHIEIATHRGRGSAYRGQAADVHTLAGAHDLTRFAGLFDQVYDLGWFEARESYADSPSTKAERCLKEVFGIEPVEALCRKYTLHVSEAARARARAWIATLPPRLTTETRRHGEEKEAEGPLPLAGISSAPPRLRGESSPRFAILHYQGTSSKEAKDLTHHDAEQLCLYLRDDFQLSPVVLDWHNACPFVDQAHVFRWDGMPADAETIAAIVAEAAVFVGIDSGPLHVAAATETPTIAVWHGFHPVHYLCPAENVVNLVPPNHADLIRGDRAAGLAYFQRAYRHRVYHSFLSDTHDVLADVLRNPGLVWRQSHWIRADNQEQDLTIVRDVYAEDCYRLAELPIPREVIVDVGACLGSFAKLAHERNPTARIICVEAAPENIDVLSKNVGAFAEIVAAAVTYEADVLALLNAVYPGCASTGGSTVLSRAEVERYAASGPQRRPWETLDGQKREYWADLRPLETVTLEALGERFGFDHIDILKLDCEGSEFSILEHCDLSRIRAIVGEYHGRERFDALIARRFPLVVSGGALAPGAPGELATEIAEVTERGAAAGWTLEILRDGEIGLFRLTNQRFTVSGGALAPGPSPA